MTTDDREALREWLAEALGAMPEARNIFDYTDEATTVLPSMAVEQIADALLPVVEERIRAEKAAAWDEGNEECCAPAYTHLNPYRAALADDREGGEQ